MASADLLEGPHFFAAGSPAPSSLSHRSEDPPNPHLHRQLFPLLNGIYESPEYLSSIAALPTSKLSSNAYPSYRDSKRHSLQIVRTPSASSKTPSSRHLKGKANAKEADLVLLREGGTNKVVLVRPLPNPKVARKDSRKASRHLFTDDVFAIEQAPRQPLRRSSCLVCDGEES